MIFELYSRWLTLAYAAQLLARATPRRESRPCLLACQHDRRITTYTALMIIGRSFRRNVPLMRLPRSGALIRLSLLPHFRPFHFAAGHASHATPLFFASPLRFFDAAERYLIML